MKMFVRGLLAVCAVVLMGSVASAAMGGSGVFVGKYTDEYSVTLKLTLDGDSASSIGTDHKSADAVKTPWVAVPVGVPFWIWFEHRDADSAKAWMPDTVHLGLETAPNHSIAVDSAGSTARYEAACQLYDFAASTWFGVRHQAFFDVVRVDTLNDTVGIAATSLKSGTANKATTPKVNLGMLRFSLCLDDADSVLDSGVRLNCYIVYRDQSRLRGFGANGINEDTYAEVPWSHDFYESPYREARVVPEWAMREPD